MESTVLSAARWPKRWRRSRQQLKADIGVAVTSVAGPEALEGKPSELAYIGGTTTDMVQCADGLYPPRREDVKWRAVT